MASGQRGAEVVRQDYIARVRYSNDLPPPPNPPKLLEIPGTGLFGGQYTSASYASKMAREQPLNIEADAELGMPIDLIGIPGIFDGDEKAIMARPSAQPMHPADKALLKPLSALGKGAGAAGSVSFLRRTEYVSSQATQQYSSSTSKDLLRLRNDTKRRRLSMHRDEPLNIIRHIVKGFDTAYPQDAFRGEDSTTNVRGAPVPETDAKAWSNPKHPSKPNLQLLDSYPVLPDMDALSTTPFYIVAKFQTNPIASRDTYDNRLDAAILRPREDPQAYAQYNQKLEEWDPNSGKSKPLPEDDYEFFLPAESTVVSSIKRKFDINDPDNADDDLYTDEGPDGQRNFKYVRIRTYETYSQTANPDTYYDDYVALALHDSETDGSTSRLAKGAYFYPIVQRTALRPKRNVGPMALSQAPQEEDRVDEIELTVVEPEKRAALDSTGKGDAAVSAAV